MGMSHDIETFFHLLRNRKSAATRQAEALEQIAREMQRANDQREPPIEPQAHKKDGI